MNEPTTEAGRALVDGWDAANADFLYMTSGRFGIGFFKDRIREAIVAGEQEAREQERARIADAVAGLSEPTLGLKGGINREAVLRIIYGTDVS